MQSRLEVQDESGTERDSGANDGFASDHSLTMLRHLNNMRLLGVDSATVNRKRGDQLFGKYVVDFLGPNLPWHSYGKIAVQQFRCAEPCVYFIGGHVGAIKIGFSIAPLERLSQFQMGSPIDLVILALAPGGQAAERAYHQRFKKYRIRGEWFEGCREIYDEIERHNPDCHRIQEWTDDD